MTVVPAEPSDRAIGPPGGPLDQPYRDHPANDNPAVGSVGPNVPEAGDPSAQEGAEGGFGATHVLYPAGTHPLHAESWAGWPVGWMPPRTASAGGATDLLDLIRQRLDIVFAALDLNARALSTFTPRVERGGKRAPNPRAWTTNPEPLVYASFTEFLKQSCFMLQGCGELFLWVTSRAADGYPQRFVNLPPWLVQFRADGSRWLGRDEIDPADILHIKYLALPGHDRGVGPLESAGSRLLAAEALTRYATSLAADGGVPWSVIKTKNKLTKDQADALKAQWIVSRRSSMGAPAVLDSEAELQVMATNPKDMALRELAEFTEARIAVLLGVPPADLALPAQTGSLTYSTVAMQAESHYRRTLLPLSLTIAQAISGWALVAGTELRLDPNPYIEPSPFERAQIAEIYIRSGVLTTDEVRAMAWWPSPDLEVAQ